MTLLERAFAAGLAAVLLALVLTPAPETASAHPSHPVTTVLLPGFNLAGWIEPEASVDELFEALPELKAAYAWDSVEQRYRSSSAQRAGDLTTLTPGMGLWLDIDGDQPIFWTRSAAPDPATGLVTLRAGWNLVAWYGSENESFEHAFSTLDAESQFVLAWDAESQWFVSHVPGAASTGAGVVRVGDAVWVSSPDERRWLQPGSVLPRVEFYGDFPADRKAEIRAETLSVVTWFAERYGLLEPDFILFVGADRASLDQARREILGIQDPSDVLCGVAVNKLVFLADWCIAATHDLTSPLAHEYFHVLQTHLVARTPTTETVLVADWLLEGTAEHTAYAYAIAQGQTTAGEVERAFQEEVIENAEAMDGLVAGISQLDTLAYRTAAFAVQYLVDQTGEAAIIEFFELLPSADGWEEAFTETFALTPAAFSSALSDHAESLRPPPVPLRTVHVTVNDPDGNPFWEWNGRPATVGTYHYDRDLDESFYSPRSDLSETGATLLLADNDNYLLDVQAACTVVGGDFFRAVYYSEVARYMKGDGDAFVVAGEDLEVVVNLVRWPGQYNINCHTGVHFWLAGRVVGEGGDPRADYKVSIQPEGDIKGYLLTRTDETGAFAIEVPDGHAYTLIIDDSCGAGVGWYNENEGIVGTQMAGALLLAGWGTQATRIRVNGADASGIEIVIPSSRETDDC